MYYPSVEYQRRLLSWIIFWTTGTRKALHFYTFSQMFESRIPRSGRARRDGAVHYVDYHQLIFMQNCTFHCFDRLRKEAIDVPGNGGGGHIMIRVRANRGEYPQTYTAQRTALTRAHTHHVCITHVLHRRNLRCVDLLRPRPY